MRSMALSPTKRARQVRNSDYEAELTTRGLSTPEKPEEVAQFLEVTKRVFEERMNDPHKRDRNTREIAQDLADFEDQ